MARMTALSFIGLSIHALSGGTWVSEDFLFIVALMTVLKKQQDFQVKVETKGSSLYEKNIYMDNNLPLGFDKWNSNSI